MKKTLVCFAAIALLVAALGPLTFAGAASAEEYEYEEYTVKPGDTLWGIAHGRLKDTYYWPLLWRENMRINNPDLIYPGQVIKIPVGVVEPEQGRVVPVSPEAEGVEPAAVAAAPEEEAAALPAEAPVPTPAPEAKAEEPAMPAMDEADVNHGVERPRPPLVTRQMLLDAGYISPTVPNQGTVLPAASGRKLFGTGDEIYINTAMPVEPGAKFYVIRSEEMITHPETGDEIGRLVRVLGVVSVEEAGTKALKARVTEAFNDIKAGDIMDVYYEVEAPVFTDTPRTPDIKAFVIGSRYMRLLNARYDLVFIDKGRGDMLEMGDILLVLVRGTDDRKNAAIQLVSVRENTSLAVVRESIQDVRRGDVITRDWTFKGDAKEEEKEETEEIMEEVIEENEIEE